MTTNIRYGIVILAAGNASRLGQPKQLLFYRNTSLLQHAVEQCLKVPEAAVVVVTGAWQESIEKALAGSDVLIRHNTDWATGMASSIKTGITALVGLYPALDAVLFAVCDQPFLTANVLASLIKKHIVEKKTIVASAYSDALGTPALFSKDHFNALLELTGQEGARKIILKYPHDTAVVDFPEGSIDIDTSEDYQSLIKA